MLRDSVNINNFNCDPVVLKKIGKTIFWPNWRKKEVSIGHAENKKGFFAKITKADHKLLKKICFIKIYVSAEL